MRRTDKLASEALAWEMFQRASSVHLASVDTEGRPVLRVLHPVVLPGWGLAFHGARKGEKLDCIGQLAVVSTAEQVADVPSTFTHPDRACPATTFYRSAQLHGVIERIEDPERKAAVLQGLMERYQPEGGYRPIRATDPFYAGAVRGVEVFGVRAERIVAKVALAQNKPDAVRAERITQLWRRGNRTDHEAVQALLDVAPLARPDWLSAPAGMAWVVSPGPAHVRGAVALLADTYWNRGIDPERLGRAQQPPWVVLERHGEVLATARALSDGAKQAYCCDVAVHPSLRGQGVGTRLLTLLLDHPLVRRCRVDLRTRDAQRFYTRFGFVEDPGRPLMRLSRRGS